MNASLLDWQRAKSVDPVAPDPSLNTTQKLRATLGEGAASAAIELARARVKLRSKLPNDLAERLVSDVPGAEMASTWSGATYKASRFSGEVQDLCCGIGVDALALVQRGAQVHAIDVDPIRAWMCAENAACRCTPGDATQLFEPGTAYHADPARRGSDGRRARSIEDYVPGGDFLRDLAKHDGAIKLGPGVQFDELPEGEIEIISENGALTQCVLWTGSFARKARRATLLTSDGAHHVAGSPGQPVIEPAARRYVATFDASVERLGLIPLIAEPLGLAMVADPRTGLLTADAPVESPWLTWFEVLESTAWNEKRVRKLMRALNAGLVEVKTRGKAVEPDRLQRSMRGSGDEPLTLFVQRLGRPLHALITRRVIAGVSRGLRVDLRRCRCR